MSYRKILGLASKEYGWYPGDSEIVGRKLEVSQQAK